MGGGLEFALSVFPANLPQIHSGKAEGREEGRPTLGGGVEEPGRQPMGVEEGVGVGVGGGRVRRPQIRGICRKFAEKSGRPEGWEVGGAADPGAWPPANGEFAANSLEKSRRPENCRPWTASQWGWRREWGWRVEGG